MSNSARKSRGLVALVCVVVAVALFSVTSLLAKLLGYDGAGQVLHPLQISGFRFVFGLITVGIVITCSGRLTKSVSRTVAWRWHLLRSVSGWAGVSLLFAAAIKMPLADANAVGFLSVVVAMLISAAVFGERITSVRWLAAATVMLGAIVVAKPGSGLFNPAVLLALGAAICIGVETVVIKFLSARETPGAILLFNNLLGTMISIPIIALVWIMPTPTQWFFLLAIGSIMVLVQLLNILAMQRAEVSFVAPYWLAVPFFAAVYDLLIFGAVPSVLTVAGMLLILVGGLWIYRSGIDRG